MLAVPSEDSGEEVSDEDLIQYSPTETLNANDETSETRSLLANKEDESRGIKHTIIVRILLFLCGMGVFARAEGFLLQTQVLLLRFTFCLLNLSAFQHLL